MGIKVKPRTGDLTGTSKKEKENRASGFSKKQNIQVDISKQQQSNGFRGESLNDHGLPDGRVRKEATPTKDYTGPKFRSDSSVKDEQYADGVKGIRIKPKTSMDSDATSVKKGTNLKSVADNHASKISKMNDKQLMGDIISNDIKGNTSRKDQDIDSLATRNIKNRGGYKEGTKGIKVKSKMKA